MIKSQFILSLSLSVSNMFFMKTERLEKPEKPGNFFLRVTHDVVA